MFELLISICLAYIQYIMKSLSEFHCDLKQHTIGQGVNKGCKYHILDTLTDKSNLLICGPGAMAETCCWTPFSLVWQIFTLMLKFRQMIHECCLGGCVRLYSSADMSLARIKGWKASVLTYWTGLFCPIAPSLLSIDDYNCPFPVSQSSSCKYSNGSYTGAPQNPDS